MPNVLQEVPCKSAAAVLAFPVYIPTLQAKFQFYKAPGLEAGPGGATKKCSLTIPVSVKANYNITCQIVTLVVHCYMT